MIPIALTVIAATAAGVAAEHRSTAAASHLRTLMLRTMLWVLGPFVVFVNISRLHVTSSVIGGVVLAWTCLAASCAVASVLARRPLALDRRTTGAAMVCTIQANTGYLGLPLCAVLFTHAEFTQAVAYDALVTLGAFVVGSFAIGAVYGDATDVHPARAIARSLVRNPLLIAIALAALVPESWVPHELVSPSRLAVYAMLPMGFVAVGVTLATEAEEGALSVPPPMNAAIATVLALRLVLTPTLLLLAGALLLDLPAPFPLLAAMPVGVNTLLVAHVTGLDLRLTAASIAWSTAIVLVAAVALSTAGML